MSRLWNAGGVHSLDAWFAELLTRLAEHLMSKWSRHV